MGVLDAEEVKGRKIALKPLLTPLETGSPVSQAGLKLIAYNLELVVLLPQLGVLEGVLLGGCATIVCLQGARSNPGLHAC